MMGYWVFKTIGLSAGSHHTIVWQTDGRTDGRHERKSIASIHLSFRAVTVSFL